MNDKIKTCNGWSEYYERVTASHRPPRDMFVRAAKRFEDRGLVDGTAIDLGCGIGIESLELLRQGWRVLSVDLEQEALDYLSGNIPDAVKNHSQTFCGSFEDVEFPKCDFIWAGNCLPFCPAEHLQTVLTRIADALNPGGRFAGDFFAPRHAWAKNKNINTFTTEELKDAFPTLDAEYWTVGEGEAQATPRDAVHWHVHTVVMRKP
jgi:SAM-dependent methyltransferase